MKHAFIFDMDGVIVDSNPTHKIALKQFCAKHGYELTEQQLREKIYGRTNRDWLLNLFGELSEETIREYAAGERVAFPTNYIWISSPLRVLFPFCKNWRY